MAAQFFRKLFAAWSAEETPRIIEERYLPILATFIAANDAGFISKVCG
jgi:hypothetical protein